MQTTNVIDRYVVARDSNVLRVDFSREPDPPAPRFPGAGALRTGRGEESDETGSAWCVWPPGRRRAAISKAVITALG